MTNIQRRLKELSDDKYASFQFGLIPGLERKWYLGVRVPDVRKVANELKNTSEGSRFINSLPHKYYDENMLHALILCNESNYSKCVELVNEFLPYVDNWAVCDSLRPKIFKKHKDVLLVEIEKWIKSSDTYTCRFGIGMLMCHYLDDNFNQSINELPLNIHSDQYYINMMIAWYYATALAKQWDNTINILEQKRLFSWVHNKTIRKACESFRVSTEHKKYLKTLIVKEK